MLAALTAIILIIGTMSDGEDWTAVTINEELEINIDNGVEVKMEYVQNEKNKVGMIFFAADGNNLSFNTELWDGNCKFTVSQCGERTLSMPIIKNGASFIMRVYRRERKIMIDIDGTNKVQIETTSPPKCSTFWGEGEINKVYFSYAAGRNAASHYKILGGDNDDITDDDDGDTDGEVEEIQVSRAESFNYHTSRAHPYPEYSPDKAHDGDYDTWYSVKDGEVAGNFLKLYLRESYKIEKVKVTCRQAKDSKVFLDRLENTEVRVYLSSGTGETEVASCGEIHVTGKDDIDTLDVEDLTFTLNCDGAVGNMIYLTDLDYDASGGHNIAEVKIFGVQVEVHCPELEIENGKLSSDNKAVGTEVTVQCLKNHVLTGQEKVTCQSSGQWTTLPQCRLKCGRDLHL